MKRKYIALSALLFLLVVLTLYQLFLSEKIDTVVEGRVYRSAQLSPESLQRIIKDKGIRTVINLRGGHRDLEWYTKERKVAEENNVVLQDVMLSPHDLPNYSTLQSVLGLLSRSERPVLIHCRRGADRTGMVSAIALAIEQDPPIHDVIRQFSWRYGVFPVYRSVGPYFFSKYGQWLLRSQKDHSRENLLFWMRNEYLDGQANLQYWVDQIGGEKVKKRKQKIVISGSPKNITVEGWAFDSRTKAPAQGLSIVIDGRISSAADFRYDRPDVARSHGLGEEYCGHFPVGWKTEFSTDRLGKGCHTISLRLMKSGVESLDVPAEYEVCF
jgi:protein tyrosine phosphatase (PTP) superfamily phosphohydrolase (DUF442 family)